MTGCLSLRPLGHPARCFIDRWSRKYWQFTHQLKHIICNSRRKEWKNLEVLKSMYVNDDFNDFREMETEVVNCPQILQSVVALLKSNFWVFIYTCNCDCYSSNVAFGDLFCIQFPYTVFSMIGRMIHFIGIGHWLANHSNCFVTSKFHLELPLLNMISWNSYFIIMVIFFYDNATFISHKS